MLILSDKVYEFFKKLVQIILPAVTALYVGLAALWELPAPEKVAGTIALVTTFLGVILGISNSTFKKVNELNAGTIIVTEKDDGGKLFSMELGDDPEVLETKNSVTFKIQRQ